MRAATVCRSGRNLGNRLPNAVSLLLLLASLAGPAGALGCRNERRPGVLIEVEVDKEEFRPDLVQFDWIAPGRPVLVRGELSPHTRPDDETFFASLFIETRGRLQEPRLIALQGRLAGGESVSGGYVMILPSIEDFRSFRLRLGPALPDADDNGVPDIVDRCVLEADTRCADGPDAGPPPLPDAAPEEDTGPTVDTTPDAPEADATPDTTDSLPDAPPTDARDAGPG